MDLINTSQQHEFIHQKSLQELDKVKSLQSDYMLYTHAYMK